MTISTPELSSSIELHGEEKSKDLSWFELLYDQYAPALYGIISSRLQDNNNSEKILLKTFRFAWSDRGKHPSRQIRTFTWLYIICDAEIKKAGSQMNDSPGLQ